jgi:hypothetical protein
LSVIATVKTQKIVMVDARAIHSVMPGIDPAYNGLTTAEHVKIMLRH